MICFTDRGADISTCETYRYLLWRQWSTSNAFAHRRPATTLFVMLNPSTADANKDDPTIRRCCDYAKSWGHNRLEVVNLFAYRATEPKDLLKFEGDRVGPLNDEYILKAAERADTIVCAWGAHGRIDDRAEDVKSLLGKYELNALRLTVTCQPQHPLYLAKDLKLEVMK